MRELLSLKNIGPKTADWLVAIGIQSGAEIEALGAVVVYRRLQDRYPVTLNALWALQGAIMDLPFNQLPEVIKADLLRQLAEE